MASSMYVIDNPRRAKARSETKPFAISKYDHLEELVPMDEQDGFAPVKREGKGDGCRVWKTRRRADNKVFLAAEFINRQGIIEDAKDTLLRLLNHPNLVCLVDIVLDTNVSKTAKDYMVWEDCNGGTLNRLLWRKDVQEPLWVNLKYSDWVESEADVEGREVPESLCWHVLNGLSKAMLWLQLGCRMENGSDMPPADVDWHPILVTYITPVNVYFVQPEGRETYGDVKLGCFGKASVIRSPQAMKDLDPEYIVGLMGQDIRRNSETVAPESEIWSLGAVLYQMMVGERPTRIRVEHDPDNEDVHWHPIPGRYSSNLKDIVRSMLRMNRVDRPDIERLCYVVRDGMRIWRKTTDEGRRFIAKGE